MKCYCPGDRLSTASRIAKMILDELIFEGSNATARIRRLRSEQLRKVPTVRARVLTIWMAFGLFPSAFALQAQTLTVPGVHTFRANGDHFELDGKPFQIISGAIHYPRVPRAYWRDRFRKARAMGLNTVETYAFWNEHETAPGVFDFSGQKDIAEFIREAHEEGLFVILRPGPYICSEWEFGGFPAWLLHDPGMAVRTADPAFIASASRWLKRLGEELAPLQIGNGGPIIAVQVENEYGAFGSDHAYMEQIHRMLLDSGFDRAMLYTADGASFLDKGSLPELPAAINFGTGNAKSDFAILGAAHRSGPKMCGEYWDGWLDHWGETHHFTNPEQEANELQWMLERGYSVNLYMFHGGTSFGWMSGANSKGKDYQPDTTSYDYDAPVSESGELGPKFFLFRDVISRVTGKTPPPPPAALPVRALAPLQFAQAATIWDNLPRPVVSEQIRSMEAVGQNYGYILYRTSIERAQQGDLHIEELHSYAQVYLDGVLVGTLDRRLNQSSLPLDIKHDKTRLDILIENTGRVNYGRQIQQERAGITHQVTLSGAVITGWSIYSLPMQELGSLEYKPTRCVGACFYRAIFDVDQPADTFLDTKPLGKGEVWLNGKPLGRFWDIGPQYTLYVPGPWLRKGRNEVVVFDLKGVSIRRLSFLEHPILDSSLHNLERRLRSFQPQVFYCVLALCAIAWSIAAIRTMSRSALNSGTGGS
jgi:beta-galactosidase